MEILKKDVLKEMEEKSRNNLNRGIDIAVSILKHEFPFITGWDYKNNPETYRLSIYLVLMADMNLASEFYNSPIRNVYRHSGARVAYPFSPLEISIELNEDEKYELFKVIQNSLLEIYDEIPSELRHEFESYSSEKKEPKDLYIDGFVFEKPKEHINENKRSEVEKNLEAINLILSEISWGGLCEIWVEYNEVDGDYEIRSKSTKRHFDHDEIVNELGYLENTLRSMGLRTYIYTPWYVEECEDVDIFLNESKEETNYIPIIEEIIEPFKNEDAVCEINVLYDEEDDMYSVYLVLGNEELNNNFFYVNGIRKYRDKLVRKIKDEIKTYLPIDNLYVGSYGKPNCGWSPLNEKHKVSKDQYVELYRDKDFVLTIPLTHEASKKYGSDTKWCTTTKECSKKFEDHKNLGILGYITVRDNDLKERLGSNAFALYRLYGDDINRTIVFDDQNNEYRNGEQWLSNKFDRFDKLSEFYKLLREFNRYFELKNTKKESINENWFKVPSSEYNSLEKIINMEMKEKYSWWKDIKINTLNYIELYGDVQIEAELNVDEEWGANQWAEFHYNTKFPGNKGWEDNDDHIRVSLGDIIDSTYAQNIRDDLREIFKYTLNIDVFGISFKNVYLIFE